MSNAASNRSVPRNICNASVAMDEALLADDFCVEVFPVALNNIRSIVVLPSSSSSSSSSLLSNPILALERSSDSILLLHDTDGDGLLDARLTVVKHADENDIGDDINHGMVLHKGYLYASSRMNVYRWSFHQTPLDVTTTTGDSPELVIFNISNNQGHRTRTLIFDDMDRLYISVGSLDNVDSDSHRSRIRRFSNILSSSSLFPIDFETGQVFADGLRNEVGLAFDRHGVLWGVENGPDGLIRPDLSQDVVENNPAEELNRFRQEDAGKHWGYPWCWTEYDITGSATSGPGTVWAWTDTMDTITDQDCRDNYMTSELAMQGHSAPLGITFYKHQSKQPEGCKGGFPEYMDGYAFITFHGSWNRTVPTGYKVVYVEMDDDGNVVGTTQDLLQHEPPNAKWPSNFRPVDLAFDECGRLVVSSDGTVDSVSQMVRISYYGPENASSATMISWTMSTIFCLTIISFLR